MAKYKDEDGEIFEAIEFLGPESFQEMANCWGEIFTRNAQLLNDGAMSIIGNDGDVRYVFIGEYICLYDGVHLYQADEDSILNDCIKFNDIEPVQVIQKLFSVNEDTAGVIQDTLYHFGVWLGKERRRGYFMEDTEMEVAVKIYLETEKESLAKWFKVSLD